MKRIPPPPTVTAEHAIRLLADGNVPARAPDEDALPLPRLEICRRLLAAFADAGIGVPHWSTPVAELFFDEEVEVVLGIEERFGLPIPDQDFEEMPTFGHLALYMEERLRGLWGAVDQSGQCATQAAFYELRRALPARSDNWYKLARLRPSTLLGNCLPAAAVEDHEAFGAWLRRRFGCDDLPVERRVLGVMKYGATWLAMWYVVLFVGGVSLLLAGPAVLGLYFVGSAVAVALLLNWLSWPVWRNGLRTLGDLTRWTVRENEKTRRRVAQCLAEQG
jgi:hypothetical protein